MFDTAVGAIVAAKKQFDGQRPGDTLRDEAAQRRAKREARRWEGGYGNGEFTGISVDFPQVFTILRNIHSMISVGEAVALYRDAYEVSRRALCAVFSRRSPTGLVVMHHRLGAEV